MFCTKCGTFLPDDARFCPKCGFPVPESLIQNQEQESHFDDENQYSLSNNEEPAQLEEIQQSSDDPPYDEQAEVKEFIGNNSDYYLRKWGKSQNPGKTVSWNWAAFFLTGYWLGYRKMYLNLLIWFVILIAFDVAALVIGTNHLLLSSIFDLIILCVNIGLGMYGNALYYRHAEKKIQRWHEDPVLQSKTALSQLGGTGWLAVILLIVVNVVISVLVFLFMAASIFNSGLNHEGLTFGTGSDDYGVTGIQDHFSNDSPIYLEATFGNPVGTDKLKVFLIKESNANEEIVDKWSQDIDPKWNSIYFNLYDPKLDGYLDPGHYIVRIYNGKNLLEEGEFDITSLSIDGGSNQVQF